MSDVRPFRALRYARELTPRLAGPYDVISDAERAQLASEPESRERLEGKLHAFGEPGALAGRRGVGQGAQQGADPAPRVCGEFAKR